MEQFTFYELYADILQGTDDVSAGKLASNICAYEFEDREPDGEMTDKERRRLYLTTQTQSDTGTSEGKQNAVARLYLAQRRDEL